MSDDAGGYDSRWSVAEYYDLVPAYAGRPDKEFYLAAAQRVHGAVLELGCGTGRLLIPLARSGATITGIDLSLGMLARCREKLQREAPAVRERATTLRLDMTSFALGQSFALVIAPFRCFQHVLDVQRQISCLRSIHQHLAPGGRLILDVFHVQPARTHEPKYSQEEVEFSGLTLPDGRTLGRSLRTAAFHRAEQINDVELIYSVRHADGREERLVHAFPMRYYFRYELEHLLARCGFVVSAVYGDYDRSPLRDESPEMIFVAEKAEPAGYTGSPMTGQDRVSTSR